jgi:hypothetical protein
MYIIIISLLTTIIFGFVDAGFFFLGSETIQTQLMKIPILTYNMVEVLTGAISASFAIFISTFIRLKIKKKYKIIESPFIDASGIMIGNIILLTLYYIFNYKKIKKDRGIKCPKACI